MRKPNSVNIIAGSLKGSLISYSPATGLRPTPARARETLFNWLMFDIKDRVCLDLFAGSGILGLEAISRGAKEVTAIDNNQDNVKQIKAFKEKRQLTNYHIYEQSALSFLSQEPFEDKFDLIFLDPPYNSDLLWQAYNLILDKQILKDDGLIYFEQGAPLGSKAPQTLEIKKSSRAGNVYYYLANIKRDEQL